MISSCSRWMVPMMSPMCPVRAWPRAESRAPGPPSTMPSESRRSPEASRRDARLSETGRTGHRAPGWGRRSTRPPARARPGRGRPGGGGGPGPGGRARWPGRRARPPGPASRPPAARGPGRRRPGARCGTTRRAGDPWPSASAVVAASAVGKAVDAPEVERLVADVELLQAGQAGAHHDVALGAGLERAPLAQVQDTLEHLAGLAAHGLETIVGAIEELLLSLQIGMVRHLAPFSPGPSGKRFSLGDGRRPGGRCTPPTMTRRDRTKGAACSSRP